MKLCNFVVEHSLQFSMPSAQHSRNDFVPIFFPRHAFNTYSYLLKFRERGRGIYIYAIRLQLIFRSQTVRAATLVWGFAFGSMHDKKDFTKNPKPLDSSASKTMQLNEFFRQPQQ